MRPIELLEGYGPFDLPNKARWRIVGTGPTLADAKEYDGGTIALNGAASVLPHSDIAIFGHYEDVLLNMPAFNKIDSVYISDPLEVGYKCIKVSCRNLFSFTYLAHAYPEKIRFFGKEPDIARVPLHALLTGPSIAFSALWLLYRNGIKEVEIFGIDGGTTHSNQLPREYKDLNDVSILWFDEAKRILLKTAEMLGMSVIDRKVLSNGL
jgi:hypothetical protein